MENRHSRALKKLGINEEAFNKMNFDDQQELFNEWASENEYSDNEHMDAYDDITWNEDK